MPWHLPDDLKYFRQITSGHTVLMGRKTYESIGRALPDRRNLILTTQLDYTAPHCEVIDRLPDSYSEPTFVIGGAQLYAQLLPQAQRLYLTRIHQSFEVDSYFPQFERNHYKLTAYRSGSPDLYSHSFLVYERLDKPNAS